MNETNPVSLMQKNVNDITVGDALKINGVVLAVMVGIPAVLIGAVEVKNRVTNFRNKRKAGKLALADNIAE